jgi:nuclear pore complex protein Nup155
MLNFNFRLFSSIIKNIPAEQLVSICDQFKQMKFYNGIVDLALLKAAEYGFNAENTTEVYQRRQQCYTLIFDALSNIAELIENSGGRARDEMIRMKHATLTRALASNDIEFHNALYTWLIAQNQVDTLLEIKSPFLEQFLVNGQDDLSIAEYLCSFYIRNNRFFDAAKLFANVAHYPGLSLDIRITYLTNAITNARSFSGSDTQEILSQLTDELDVARVQSEILAQLSCIPDKDDDCAILNGELLDIGALFHNARSNFLFETMLHIFFISDHSNDKSQLYIQECWEGIIAKILNNSANPVEELADKVKELGRKFYPDENVFSLKFLVSRLESLTFDYIVNRSLECDRNWVCRTFLDIKIPHSRLFTVYQGLYEAKLPPWSPGNALVFLIESILFLIERWFDHIRSPSVSMYERDEFPARIIDEALSNYLMIDGVSGRRAIMEQLTLIQKRVRVLF